MFAKHDGRTRNMMAEQDGSTDCGNCLTDKYNFRKDAKACRCGVPCKAAIDGDPLDACKRLTVCQFWSSIFTALVASVFIAFNEISYNLHSETSEESLGPFFIIGGFILVTCLYFLYLLFYMISLLVWFSVLREPYCCVAIPCVPCFPFPCCCPPIPTCLMIEGDCVALFLAGLLSIPALSFGAIHVMLAVGILDWNGDLGIMDRLFLGVEAALSLLMPTNYLVYVFWRLFTKRDEIHAFKAQRDLPSARQLEVSSISDQPQSSLDTK